MHLLGTLSQGQPRWFLAPSPDYTNDRSWDRVDTQQSVLGVCWGSKAAIEITFRKPTVEAVPPCSGLARLLVMSQNPEIYRIGGLGKNSYKRGGTKTLPQSKSLRISRGYYVVCGCLRDIHHCGSTICRKIVVTGRLLE